MPSLPVGNVAAPQNQLEIQKSPQLQPLTAKAVMPEVLGLDNGKNNGRHSMRQMLQLLQGRGMTQGQSKGIFNTVDVDKTGDISDEEWSAFYETFYSKYVACDVDADNMLSEAEMLICLNATDAAQMQQLTQLTAKDVSEVAELMDVKLNFNLYDYMFLRRINSALTNCGDNGIMQPQKIYCALSITSPRTRHVYTPEERQVYLAAIILVDGFYYGQVSYLSPVQLIGVSYIYNYFSDYELPYNDGIVEKVDFIRSVQDGMLPYIYNPMAVEQLFEDMESMDFFALAQSVYGFRKFLKHTDPDSVNPNLRTMNLAKFNAMLLTFPSRLQNVMNNSDVPTQEQIEIASTSYWQLHVNQEDRFLRNFNNLIFMEKKNKVTQVPAAIQTKASAMTFETGPKLFFNIMNVKTNGFNDLPSFMRFYRFSSMYLEFDPYAKQKLSYDQISKVKKPLTLQSMCKKDRFMFEQMVDFLSGKSDFFLNFKQFIEWYFFEKVFDILRNTGHSQTTGMDRLVVGFHFLGLRLSKYSLNQSIKKYDSQLNESSVLFRQAFIIAITEEIQAQRTAFRTGLMTISGL